LRKEKFKYQIQTPKTSLRNLKFISGKSYNKSKTTTTPKKFKFKINRNNNKPPKSLKQVSSSEEVLFLLKLSFAN